MSDIIAKLKGVVGDENVVTADIAQYLKGNEQPAAVVFPGSTEDVAGIVKAAYDANTKINVGGKVVDTKGLKGGIAIVMSRMNTIEEIDHENLTCWVQPGMGHQELVEKLAAEKLYFAPEPYTVATSSVGGCFGIGDVDSKAFNYMPTRTYILAYEMVLPTGEIMKIGSKCIKCVSGYDMIHFVVGAQATMGIFTRILVKLLPLPVDCTSVVAEVPNLAAAAKAIKAIQKRRIFPTRINALNNSLGNGVQATSGALVIVDIEGYSNSCTQYAKEVEAELKIVGATSTKIVTDKTEYKALWDKWLAVRGQINNEENKVKFTVGPANLPQALASLKDIVGDLEGGSGVLIEGLIGKITVYTDVANAGRINKMAMSFGGNVSGLLGSKLRCQAYNDSEMESELLRILNSIRSQFDPKGIIAPGIKF